MTNKFCHVCGELRPVECLSEYKKPLIRRKVEVGIIIVRYCNDNASCVRGAPKVDMLCVNKNTEKLLGGNNEEVGSREN